MAGSPLSIGTNDTTVFNADKTDFKTVTTYDVYNASTGTLLNFPTYAAAAEHVNNNGGSAAVTPPGQQNISYAGSDPAIESAVSQQKALDQGLKAQNEANATGMPPPAPVDPVTDPKASAGETVAVPASDVKTEATPVQPSPASGQVAYDDEGNLLPGYTLTENNDPVYVGNGFVEPATQALADQGRAAVTTGVFQAQNQETNRNLSQMPVNTDWRVVLRLAPGSNYLYNASNAGLLAPLKVTNGVIFPYTPQISTAYKANYSSYDLTHSNYRGYFYQNSYVDAITLNASFTAQSTADASYVLAVIHFFRSVTKMFYGQDAQRGSPPPLVFLSGLGDYQFNNHPCLVQQFNYTLPPEVDYISSGAPNNLGLNLQPLQNLYSSTLNAIAPTATRLAAAFLPPGAQNALPAPLQGLLNNPTYVPSKLDIVLTLLPVQSRQQVSTQFSLKDFSTGQLLKGGFW